MKTVILAAAMIFSACASASAQDFSSSFREYDLISYRSIGGGAAVNSFARRPDNPLPDSLSINFTSPMFFLEYRQMDLRVAAAYSHYSLRGEAKSSYAIYAEGSTDLAIDAGRRGGLFIPIILATNYVRAAGQGPSAGIFDVGSIGIGAGLKYRMLSEAFGMQLYGGAVVHYATVGFSVEYGTSVSARGELQFLLPEFLWNGVTAGYRFDTQNWRMSEEKFNYTRQTHGIFVGFFF